MNTAVNILIGFLFFFQAMGFYSEAEKYFFGLKFRRLGEKGCGRVKNPRKAAVPAVFMAMSITAGICLILFSPHWTATLLLGIYVLITLHFSESKRNYLACPKMIVTYNRLGGRVVTYGSNVREYLLRGPLWLFSDHFWEYGFE